MKNIFFLFMLVCLSMTGSSQIQRGQPAPDISLQDTSGHTVSLSSLKGKVVLIDFWASWCAPCRKNTPKLHELYEKYHERGFEIFGVSIDEEVHRWKIAIGQDAMAWMQVNDPKGWNAASALSYGVEAIPAYFVIDRQGLVQRVNPQFRKMESDIKSLLK
ncbi:MAG: TlpA family protein disulfide reductase [Chitinophagales bacterium]